jgi:3-hydroxyacyl-CoA dehydrogenase
VQQTAAALAEQHGIARRAAIGADEIVERLLYPMINEAAKILEERIAYRPGDIDVIWVAGYGFPDHRGGPVWMADDIGLATIVTALDRFAAERGDSFDYWTVAPLLRRLAASGERLSDWRRAG